MNRSIGCSLLVMLLGLSGSQAGAPVTRFTSDPGAGESELVISVPPASWEDAAGGVFPRIQDFGRLGLPGAPDVPARRERVALPPGGALAITEVLADWAEGVLPGNLVAFPALDPRRPELDPATGRDGWWPEEPVVIAEPDGAFRTLRFATLEIRPLQVDLQSGRFRVARSITIRVRRDAAGASFVSARRAGRADEMTEALADTLALGASDAGRAAMAPSSSLVAAPASEGVAQSYPAWQFDVDRDGLYRISYEWAQTSPALLSFLTGHDPRQLRMSVQGLEIPLLVQGEADGVFGPGDAILFYGEALRGDPFAPDVWQAGDFGDVHPYRLEIGANPLRVLAAEGTLAPGHAAPQPSYRATARKEQEDLFVGFVPHDGMDHWYVPPVLTAQCQASCTDPLPDGNCGGCGGSACCAASVDQVVDTPGHAGGPITVRARMLGFEYANNLHRTEIHVNGILRDTRDWEGYREFTQGVDSTPVTFTPAAPLDAATTVKVRMPLGRSGAPRDTITLNWVELDYDHDFSAVADALSFTAANATNEVNLKSFTGQPEVWDVSGTSTSPAGLPVTIPRRVTGVQAFGAGYGFGLDPVAGLPATRRFASAAGAGYLAPRAAREDRQDAGGGLKAADRGANWIVIGKADLLDTTPGSWLSALVERRRATTCADPPCATAVVDVQDVYDEFTFGIPDPQAIREFLAYALANWVPAPAYVVLVGDATRDYKNIYGRSPSRQFVPTYMFDITSNSNFGYYPSDTWFAAVVGNDEVPDAVVGRIPAHSLAEAEEVFRKIVAYETGAHPAAWAGRACMVSEYEQNAPNLFRDPHEAMISRYFTGTPQVAQRVYEQSLDEDCTDGNPNLRPMYDRVRSCLNAPGAALLSYVGHGAYKAWGKSCTIFGTSSPTDVGVTEDLNGINAGTPLSFQIHANCITGHFPAESSTTTTNDNWYTFLEDWLTTSNKGVVGGFAPSHLTYTEQLESVLDSFYSDVFGPYKERLAGRVDIRLRSDFDLWNDVINLRSFVFEGDPATILAIPAPAPTRISSIAPNGTRTLRVTWDAVPGAARYRLYRATVASGPYSPALETTSTAADDTGLENCRTYYYYAVSVDADGFESRWSNFNNSCVQGAGDADCQSGTPENPAGPAAPAIQSLVDTRNGGELEVSWSAPPDPAFEIVRYVVSWRTTGDAGTPPAGEKSVGPAFRTTRISGLENGQRYWVWVRAENCSRPGAASVPANEVPHVVRGINPPRSIGDLRVRDIGTSLRLEWTVPTESVWGVATSVTGIEVYGSTTGPVFPLDATTKRASLGPTATSWDHAGQGDATPNPRWFYTVVAVDADGRKSAGGDELPKGIDDLRVERLAPNLLRFSWTAVAETIDGRPLHVPSYNLYGRTAVLPRTSCGSANLLRADIPAAAGTVQTTITQPGEAFWSFQVLAEDDHGGESVW